MVAEREDLGGLQHTNAEAMLMVPIVDVGRRWTTWPHVTIV